MAKYIDADLLRKDIDNWKEAMADAVGEYSNGVRFALEHFTFVLDSLQQEQPSESLEEAAIEYATDTIPLTDEVYIDARIKASFIAGAEWQKKRFEAEYELDWLTDLKKDLYELGRKDEREQMLKEAVEIDVDDLNGYLYNHCIDNGLTSEDEVKIIIIPQDDDAR